MTSRHWMVIWGLTAQPCLSLNRLAFAHLLETGHKKLMAWPSAAKPSRRRPSSYEYGMVLTIRWLNKAWLFIWPFWLRQTSIWHTKVHLMALPYTFELGQTVPEEESATIIGWWWSSLSPSLTYDNYVCSYHTSTAHTAIGLMLVISDGDH